MTKQERLSTHWTPEMIEELASKVEYNENFEACNKCGGACCRLMGCDIYPHDVKRWFGIDTITKDVIMKLLDSGAVILDWWEDDVRDDAFGYTEDEIGDDWYSQSYYLHMRAIDEQAVQGSWGGTCRMFDKNTGCKLSWDQRPAGGKSLIPHPEGNHMKCDASRSKISKAECCLAWIPYHDMMEEIYETYESMEVFPYKESLNDAWTKLVDEIINQKVRLET